MADKLDLDFNDDDSEALAKETFGIDLDQQRNLMLSDIGIDNEHDAGHSPLVGGSDSNSSFTDTSIFEETMTTIMASGNLSQVAILEQCGVLLRELSVSTHLSDRRFEPMLTWLQDYLNGESWTHELESVKQQSKLLNRLGIKIMASLHDSKTKVNKHRLPKLQLQNAYCHCWRMFFAMLRTYYKKHTMANTYSNSFNGWYERFLYYSRQYMQYLERGTK